MIPDWSKYDVVIAGVSGGKDSQAAATWLAEDSGCPKSKIRLTFNDTGNEHQWTYGHILYMERTIDHVILWLKPELDFYHLAEREKRFPSAKARFCTEHLKMLVSQQYTLGWMRTGAKVLLITGVRHSESLARSQLPEFGFDDFYACDVYRPLIDWSLQDVFDYISRKGQHPNPLHSLGAQRVGCFPCIMSRKHEIRMIADNFPERIDMIREWENKIGGGGASFYPRTFVPEHYRRKVFSRNGKSWMVASIDDVVDWSHTARGGKEYDSGPQMAFGFYEEAPTCINNSGACE